MEFSRSLTFLPAMSYETVRRLTSVYYRVRYGGGELDIGQRLRLGRVIGRLGHELGAMTPAPTPLGTPAPA